VRCRRRPFNARALANRCQVIADLGEDPRAGDVAWPGGAADGLGVGMLAEHNGGGLGQLVGCLARCLQLTQQFQCLAAIASSTIGSWRSRRSCSAANTALSRAASVLMPRRRPPWISAARSFAGLKAAAWPGVGEEAGISRASGRRRPPSRVARGRAVRVVLR